MTLFLLFSHALTSAQADEAARRFGVERFVPLPGDLQALWSHIPPELETLEDYLQPVQAWLRREAEAGDCLLLAGDFGAVCHMVDFGKSHELVPVYATSKRIAIETKQPDGSVLKQSCFEHVRFRIL